MSSDELSSQFKELYDQWGEAIASHNYDWFERHFSDDFLGTAQPWPTLSVNKQQMIELDKSIEVMETEWQDVTAKRFGDIVLTSGVVKYTKEVFKAGARVADGMPTGDQLSSLSNGRSVLYINAWRYKGSHWEMFDHHMVCVVPDLDLAPATEI